MFEYKVLIISTQEKEADIESKLNELGKEGWNLVTCESSNLIGRPAGYTCIFKREE